MWVNDLVQPVRRLAQAAAVAIMRVYSQPFASEAKSDGSPVTAADLAADDVICAGLASLTPEIPVVSEERVARGVPDISAGRFWLVDPLDGTREFVDRNGEFTVNIALVEKGQPVLGCVGIPVEDLVYTGIPGSGAWRWDGAEGTLIAARRSPPDPVAVASRSHRDAETERFLNALPGHRLDIVGSALKFCRIAEGRADVYPRFGPTSEWDTAAGHALVLAAGGRLAAWDGSPFCYGKPRFLNGGFVARGCG
jgi:3'(2'), 5'-bisphosphate nucleotidase